MTNNPRTAQELLQEQFRITSELSAVTGEHHRLLQQLAAAAITQQMTEDDATATEAALSAAQDDVSAARNASEAYETRITALEQQLDAVIRELSERH